MCCDCFAEEEELGSSNFFCRSFSRIFHDILVCEEVLEKPDLGCCEALELKLAPQKPKTSTPKLNYCKVQTTHLV
jgi:hypothetical protein